MASPLSRKRRSALGFAELGVINDIPADSWGYDGETQAQRAA
jgi:hypothetical protein